MYMDDKSKASISTIQNPHLWWYNNAGFMAPFVAGIQQTILSLSISLDLQLQ